MLYQTDARGHAFSRLERPPTAGATIELTIDFLTLSLTPTEYRVLEVLVTNAGRLCTHRFLLEHVREAGHEQDSQYLVRHMASLRRKLDDASAPQLLVTEPGMGYRFLAPP